VLIFDSDAFCAGDRAEALSAAISGMETPQTVTFSARRHGAFADASSFARLIPLLLDDGISVLAPAVPNRSLTGDAAYIASVVRQIDVPWSSSGTPTAAP
jgi:hypothetical protein